jgi:hypothetical protein
MIFRQLFQTKYCNWTLITLYGRTQRTWKWEEMAVVSEEDGLYYLTNNYTFQAEIDILAQKKTHLLL